LDFCFGLIIQSENTFTGIKSDSTVKKNSCVQKNSNRAF